ncbi:DUF6090 family protein [Flavobacteriaceae bacterium S0825]|uniref:DUF6090 family protein n=1 Tax=Gaetbulibacter sp. S0825 TaxID=2720084 RepID=UPI00142F7783|nr:DUF6090 family protein [Gaetbulibacter sp. S0825]MCK0109241.1 DUF6090 family protein [Flavobacteriaceae bacterium S0825]NIX64876.1 hypothetical protein [Gaetbulibacter sp. S0825]
MSENKTGKYLKYAIGEIVLVVIGILMALQINNWNEARKEARTIANVLIEIKEDLIEDKAELNLRLKQRTAHFKAQKRIYDALEKRAVFNEEIRLDLGNVLLAETMFSSSKGYELLKELNLGALTDKSLRILLTQYYERDIPHVHQENIDDKFEFENFWLPYVRKHFKDWTFGEYGDPVDYAQILNDQSLLTAIKINSQNLEATLQAYSIALKTATKLIKEIDLKINIE